MYRPSGTDKRDGQADDEDGKQNHGERLVVTDPRCGDLRREPGCRNRSGRNRAANK